MNLVVSLVFLAGRIADGMPAGEAFGKFFMALALGTAVYLAGALLGRLIINLRK